MQRRGLLAALGATGAALAAGCLSNTRRRESESPPPATGTPSGVPTTIPSSGEPDADPQIRGTAIETLDTRCMSAASGSVNVTFGDDRLMIDGVAQTPTPCHEAAIKSAVVETNEVILRVEFPRIGDQCVNCVGAIEYAAVLEMAGTDGVETVTVVHGDKGERYTHTREREESTAISPTDTSPHTPTKPASQQPNPDLDVILANADEMSHEYAVTIRRDSGSIVYEATHTVPAEHRRRIYNFAEANPEGIEAFTITVVVGDHQDSITVKTNACYGNAHIEVTAAGELYPFYSIC